MPFNQPMLPGISFPRDPIDDWFFRPWGGKFSDALKEQVKRPRSPFYPQMPPWEPELPFNTPEGPQPTYGPTVRENPHWGKVGQPTGWKKAKSIAGKIAGSKTLGKIVGRGTTASITIPMGAGLLEQIAPSNEYYTPADVGAEAYDWLADKGKDLWGSRTIPQQTVANKKPVGTREAVRISREQSTPKVTNVGRDVNLEQELPPFDVSQVPSFFNSSMDEGIIGDVTPPVPPKGAVKGTIPPGAKPVKRAAIRPKKPVSLLAAFSMGKESPITELPGENLPTMEPLDTYNMGREEALRSEDLPGLVTLGDKDNNSALGNKDSQYPDAQQNNKAFQRYMDLVMNMPDEGNYKPSIWRKLVGAAAGASAGWFGGAGKGLETSTGFVREPYNRAMEQWQGQLNELEPLMEMESRMEMNQARIDEAARKTDLINQTKTVENEIKRLAVEGKIKSDTERNAITRRIAEIRQDIANGQHELAKAKLEEIRNYHQGLLGVAKGRLSLSASDTAADNARANAALELKKRTGAGGPSNPNLKFQRAQTAALDVVSMLTGNEEVDSFIYGPMPEEAKEDSSHPYHTIRKLYKEQLARALELEGLNPIDYGIKTGNVELPTIRK